MNETYYRTCIEDEEITTIDLDEWVLLTESTWPSNYTAPDDNWCGGKAEVFIHGETGRLLLLVSYENGEVYGNEGRDFVAVEGWTVLGPYYFGDEVCLFEKRATVQWREKFNPSWMQ